MEEITPDNLEKQFGKDWREGFKKEYGMDWKKGMRYSEISNIRSKEELERLFGQYFDIKITETQDEYILKMKKRE